MEVFWQGPSVGWDFGGNASRVFTLCYNLQDPRRDLPALPGRRGLGLFHRRPGRELPADRRHHPGPDPRRRRPSPGRQRRLPGLLAASANLFAVLGAAWRSGLSDPDAAAPWVRSPFSDRRRELCFSPAASRRRPSPPPRRRLADRASISASVRVFSRGWISDLDGHRLHALRHALALDRRRTPGRRRSAPCRRPATARTRSPAGVPASTTKAKSRRQRHQRRERPAPALVLVALLLRLGDGVEHQISKASIGPVGVQRLEHARMQLAELGDAPSWGPAAGGPSGRDATRSRLALRDLQRGRPARPSRPAGPSGRPSARTGRRRPPPSQRRGGVRRDHGGDDGALVARLVAAEDRADLEQGRVGEAARGRCGRPPRSGSAGPRGACSRGRRRSDWPAPARSSPPPNSSAAVAAR